MYGSYVTHDGANESPGVLRPVYSSVLILTICICALVGGLVVPVGVYICARTVRIYGMEDIMYVSHMRQEMVPTTLQVQLGLLMIPYRCFNYVCMFS